MSSYASQVTLGNTTEGSQGKSWSRGHEGMLLISCSLWLALPAFLHNPGPPGRDGTAHSELGHTTWIKKIYPRSVCWSHVFSRWPSPVFTQKLAIMFIHSKVVLSRGFLKLKLWVVGAKCFFKYFLCHLPSWQLSSQVRRASSHSLLSEAMPCHICSVLLVLGSVLLYYGKWLLGPLKEWGFFRG